MVWSLAYEMVFYLMLTALFLGGVHRRSNRYALVFAAAAVGLGGLLVPGSLSYDLLTPGVVVAITDSLVLVGLVLTLAGRGRTRLVGAVLAAATGLKVPRALAWLGLVSYSVYLLHPVLIEVYDSVPWTQNENFVPMEFLLVAVFILVLLVCCGLTHRYIEAPMQRLGRRVAGRLDARFGPDAPRPLRPRPDPATAGPAGPADGVASQADGVAGQADGLAARR